MTDNSRVLQPLDVLRMLRNYPLRWIVPTAVMTVAALAYAMLHRGTWEASQALVVRDELHRRDERLGKFGDLNEMKTTQETVVELARSESVVAAALAHVGPPADRTSGEAWPTKKEIAEAKKQIHIAAPGGAELGKTEVFYLKVQDTDRDRALALTGAVADGARERFGRLLVEKARGMIVELEQSVALAEADLADSTARLSQLESGVGRDLAELRILNDTPSGQSDLRQKTVEIENELRRAEASRRDVKQLLVLLTAARDDDTRLVALPGRLLASHDTLRRLIEGLGTARLRTSNLLGSKSNDHPLVRAAKAEEVEVLADLRSELDGAIEIAAVEAMLRDREVKALRAQLAETQGRLTRLAGLRARYENLVVLAAGDAKLVEGVRRQLAEARASAAAGDAGLIARIDTPDAGTRPVGPSRSMIVAAGFGGGLLTGLAILFITVPSPGHVVAYSLAWQATGWSADSPRRIAELAGSWQSTQRSGSVESLLNAGRSSGLSFKEALQKGEPLRRAVA